MVTSTKIFNRLLKGGGWATAGKVLFTVGTLAWNGILTRILDKEDVGVFYLIASVVVFGELMVLCGMNHAVMRLIATNSVSNRGVRPVIKGTAFLLTIFILIAGLFYVFVIGPQIGMHLFHSRLMIELAGLTAAWFALRAIQTYIAFILRGFHKIGIAGFIDGASTAIFITVALIYVWNQPGQADIRKVLTIIIGALSSTVVFSLYVLRKIYLKVELEPGISLKEPIRIGMPLSVLAISSVAITQASIWIAGIFTSTSDVAIYGAIIRLSKFVEMPLLIINGIIPSTIAQLSAINDKAKIEKVMRTVAGFSTLSSLLIATVLFLFSKNILAFLFGSTYSAGWNALLIVVFGQAISVAVGSPGVLMAMTDHQNKSMIIGICSGLIGTIISLSLVETHGILGVAIGAAIGKVTQNVTLWVYCLKVARIKTHANLFALSKIRQALHITRQWIHEFSFHK